ILAPSVANAWLMRPPRFFAPPPTRTTFSFSECLFIGFEFNGYSCFVFSICEKHLDEILTSFNLLTFGFSGTSRRFSVDRTESLRSWITWYVREGLLTSYS